MESVLKGITTIIFDLGGVVLNLDPDRSARAFAKLSNKPVREIYKLFQTGTLLPTFEKGVITAEQFRHRIQNRLAPTAADGEIDAAWNAMLLDLPIRRLELLSGLRDRFKTLVLSNTNEIHIAAFDRIVGETVPNARIQDFFDRVYYSHELGMRKPDAEIFEFIIQANDLIPEQTLFIDDMAENITTAEKIGLQTFHLTDQNYLFELFT